jgi:hypothetical protein
MVPKACSVHFDMESTKKAVQNLKKRTVLSAILDGFVKAKMRLCDLNHNSA